MYFDLRTQTEKKPFLRSNIPFGLAVFIMLVLSFAAAWMVIVYSAKVSTEIDSAKTAVNLVVPKIPVKPEVKPQWHFTPGPVSMDVIKKKGCVADGFLSGYGSDISKMTKLINRSECVYLHRALETWLKPPNFDLANSIMEKVDKKPVVYGMFIAEAISMKKEYTDPVEDRNYHFDKMCRNGTQDRWAKDTCVPSIQSVEYRRYLRSIMERAIDTGIQSFLFGQIQLQDEQPNFQESEIKGILADVRQYAQEKGIEIIIGAQTNSITDEKYLKLFDYIEGGVGIDEQGHIENGACLSRFSNCWALLWNDKYRTRANDVLLHLDWSGLPWDDMGVFARMSESQRIKTLENLYQNFTSRDMGFLMPFLAVLNRNNNGCYGPSKNFYTPDNKYHCKDEDSINKIMRKSLALH